MAISFSCGHCGKPFHVGPEVAGKTGRCKRCGRLMLIPARSTTRPVRTWAPDGDEGDDDLPGPQPAAYDPVPAPLPPRAPGVGGPRGPVAPARAGKAKRRKSAGGGAFAGRSKAGFWSVAGLVGLILFGLRVYNTLTGGLTRAVVATTIAQYDDKPIELPALPDPGPGREIEPGVMLHEVVLGPSRRSIGGRPGHGGKLWLYLPARGGADHSLPCVLMAGAGSPLFIGMALDESDRPSHLPFARAGFAVLAFELDGAIADRAKASDDEWGKAAIRFRTARAGLVNAHIALEYALRKVPAIDPARISIAGHSSAGTLALLFAEAEPRLRSAVAFAPAVDVARRFPPDVVAILQKGGLGDLHTRFSPINGAADLRCPVYLFQARDDDNTPAAEADDFVAHARAAGKEVTYDVVGSGGHAGALLAVGFPHAIAWLRGEPLPAAFAPAPDGAAVFGGPAADPPPPRADRAEPARADPPAAREDARQAGRRAEPRAPRAPAPAPPPAADPLPTNPVERERALFEAAKRRRDAQRQKTLGRGAASGGEPDGSNPP